MKAELQNFRSHNILCAKAELRDLKPKLLCGSGTVDCFSRDSQAVGTTRVLFDQIRYSAELPELKKQNVHLIRT